MTLLSIIIPSNRKLKAARASLESAIIYADKVDAKVIVADNSDDPDKRRHFQNASPRLVYIDTTGLNAQRNMMTTLSRVDTPFVMPMGDDDEVYGLERPGRPDLASLPEDVIGIRPITMTWSIDGGVRSVERYTITEHHSDDRIAEFSRANPKNNSIYYSVYRSSLFTGLFEQFNRYHPTCGGYCDWALTYTFIACGRMLHDPTTIFRYDLGRWADRHSMEESKLALYRQVGMPEEAERYSALLGFIDTHGFLMWKDLPLSSEERQRALRLNAQMDINTFLKAVAQNPTDYSPQALTFVEQIKTVSDLDQAFALALPVIDALKPGLADRYVAFLRGVTGVA